MQKDRCSLFARLIALSAMLSLSPSTVLAQQCDRACLTGMMTQFINGLVAHDSSKLPLAANVRYTEDSRNAQLGQGVWQSVTAAGGFRQDYIDRANRSLRRTCSCVKATPRCSIPYCSMSRA